MKQAVIVIDMIHDFVDGVLGSAPAQKIVPDLKSFLEVARKDNVPVIYTNDAHLDEIDNELKLWGNHGIKGTHGGAVVPELTPQAGDFVIEKRRYSAFFGTSLDLLLQELGVTNVILTGVATNICVQSTAMDAFFRNYAITIVRETTASFDPDAEKYALDYMKSMFAAEIVTVNEVF
ncbi:MAG: cysteine hydrolase [Bifidobacteriaceae bacterium]|jgi:nicotinamidase-related amidase|nr:cysteine hydrolase [Bifidobacteriaceae bacterium]